MKRGEIYWVRLDPTEGSEIKKTRPCVVLSVNPINSALDGGRGALDLTGA